VPFESEAIQPSEPLAVSSEVLKEHVQSAARTSLRPTCVRDGRIVNALTIDFEDWYHGIELPMARWGGLEGRIESSGRRALEVLSAAGVKATFFVLAPVAERYPRLVQEIASGGHEVATHGYSHTLIYRQDKETFREELARSISVLEDVTGEHVLGHRAPYFSITRASLWAFEVIAELGLRYDSSIFPVSNYRYGIVDAPRWPYEVPIGDRTVLEFPITTWRVAGRNVPVGGGAYFRIFPYAFTRRAFRSANSQKRPAVFYLHPWELDPDHPRLTLPRRISATHYANLRATEKRLRRLLHEFQFAPMRDVLGVG
jgi:polysaccharide deacetylase family protein (PEP-CTERM system associated)